MRARHGRLGCLTAALLAAVPVPSRAESQRLHWTPSVADPARSALRVQNTGEAPARIEWVALSGRRVFGSLAEIQEEIDAIPAEADGSDATRVFRFVAENRQHDFPITVSFAWLLTPTLFFVSSGVGLCSEAAAEVNLLAADRGLPAREWGLDGHVVAEIRVGGRWQMYDADYGVYFLNRTGQIASVGELELDATLMTDPVVRLETHGLWSPYTPAYAALFTSRQNNAVARASPRPTLPPRPLAMALPRGASLRFPGRFAPAPPDYSGAPLTAEHANLVLRLPAGTTGPIENPFLIHTLRGLGRVSVAGEELELGSAALAQRIDARTDPLERIELLEARTAVEVIYLLNPLRWRLAPTTTLELDSDVRSLVVSVESIGDPARDSDLDGVSDDGDQSGVVGDAPCADGTFSGCDDSCVARANGRQLDADGDGLGNACDGDFDQDELSTAADLATLRECLAGGAPPADPSCTESDLNEDARVDALDQAALRLVQGSRSGAASCGLGAELPAVLAGLGWLARRRSRRSQ